MKKVSLLILLAIGFSLSAMAQVKPVAGDISLGFRITGLGTVAIQSWDEDAFEIPEVMGRYYLTDRIALRSRIGLELLNTSGEFSDQYLDTVRFALNQIIDSATTSSISSFGFSITPGAEYHLLADASKLDPYVGAEVSFGYKGVTSTELDQIYERAVADDGSVIFRENLNIKTRTPGGISIGFNLLGGFNYFFTDKIAVGAEYSIGFLNQRQGGKVEVATTGTLQDDRNSLDIITIDQTETFQNTTTGTSIVTGSTGGVNFSIFW